MKLVDEIINKYKVLIENDKRDYFYYDNYLRYRLISLLSNKVFLSIFTEQEIFKKLCAHIKNKSESIWHEEFTENDFIIKKFVTDNKV